MAKLAIYTAIFGGYDGLIPQTKNKNIDFICFTDQPLKSRSWRVVQVEPLFQDDLSRSSRLYKIKPHLWLPEYEKSIYVDGNFIVRGNVVKLADELLAQKPMWAFDHACSKGDQRACIYEEHRAIVKMYQETGNLKDKLEVMAAQVERYRQEGFPEGAGLINGGVLIRAHHHPDVIHTMNIWWEEVVSGSKRDQLSFNYAAWKTGLSVGYLRENIRRNPWFFMMGTHRKDYSAKLIRYRLKRLVGLV